MGCNLLRPAGYFISPPMRRMAWITLFFCGAVFAPMLAQAQWWSQDLLTFPAGFTLPLNTSSSNQMKSGNLTVNGGFTVGASGLLDVRNQICWNGVCQNSWTPSSTNLVRRLTLPVDVAKTDLGFPELFGDETLVANDTLTGKAATPTATRGKTSGIAGIAASGSTYTSAGVTGEVGNHVINGIAIYGDTVGNQSAWAGYFVGKVRIESPYDLIVGDLRWASVQQAKTETTSYVCLGDASGKPFGEVCRSSWNAGTLSMWARNGNTIWPGTYYDPVAIGGSTASAKFRIIPRPDLTADVFTSNDVTAKAFVVGSPTGLQDNTVTCGDGICNGGESSTNGSPTYCVGDCDHIPPDPAYPVPATNPVAPGVTALENPDNTVTFTWKYADLEFSPTDNKGTRIVRKPSTPVLSPREGTPAVAIDRPGACTQLDPCSWTSPALPPDTSYYFAIYAYDFADNYSTPVMKYARFGSPGMSQPAPPDL